GLEAQERIASGSEYREVIREIGKPLVGMLKENERRERALPAGGREPEDPAEGRQEPAGAGEGREDEARGPLRPEWYVTFEGVIPQFLGWARAGSDPADRAGQVIFNLPDDYVRVLAKAVEDPDFIEEFVAYVPEADDHRPWLREFFADLRDTFYGTEEPVQEPEAGAQGPEPDPEPQGPGAPDREPAFEPDPDPEPVSGGD
ncbi:MAG: hypothetical protein GWN71_11180, partial [Gammaproteobacteria bacterium]|nr:hypothetical protein [Gemmatimonadota bacterium]NIU74119.1 hypothetical protein [Gammaproteobacteria bacterium]